MINRGFINRNRVYWMNTRGVADIKVIINADLFNIPEEISNRDEVSVNIKHSDRPLAVGVMSYMSNDTREYLSYGNDELGNIEWLEKYESFKDALISAKSAYMNNINDIHYDYKYIGDTKVLKK